MSTVFKLRHKPTGLFYQPVKGRFKDQKTNLAKNGKIYTSEKFIGDISKPFWIDISKPQSERKYSVELKFEDRSYSRRLYTHPEDWEIIEYELTEVTVR